MHECYPKDAVKLLNGTWQHGDVLFKPVEEFEKFMESHKSGYNKFEQERDWDGVILEGSATGNAHRVAPKDLGSVEFLKSWHTQYLYVKKATDIVHEEHNTHTLPPGLYQIDRVRMNDHFTNKTHFVYD